MLVASLRNQLLLAPATTPGGGVYQRFPGTPASACDTNACTAGDATKMPSELLTIVYLLLRMSPTHRATARSGVKAIVTASLKLSVVPVLAATMRSAQCSWHVYLLAQLHRNRRHQISVRERDRRAQPSQHLDADGCDPHRRLDHRPDQRRPEPLRPDDCSRDRRIDHQG